MKVASQLVEASLENLSSDPAVLPYGRIWLNTTDNLVRAVINGITRDFVTAGTNFTAGTITGTFVGNITGNVTGNVSGTAANVTGTVAIANGGTNSTTALNNNRVMQSSGGAIVEAAAITAARALISDANGIPTHSAVTSTELGYLTGVTSAIQTQIDTKAPSASPTFSGTITTPLTASRALVTGASSELAVSATTATELGYLSGVTSAVQTQLDAKAPLASPTFTGTVTGTFSGNITGNIVLGAGSVSAPSASFTGDSNTGMYAVGADDIGFAVGGFLGLEVKKSTGSFGNVGMGSTPSSSDNYPLLISRTNTSSGTVAQIANPSTSANAKATYELSTDAGNITGELSAYTSGSTVHAYISALVLRATGSAVKTTIAGPYITFYSNSDLTSTGEIARFNADKSLQLMQEIATPATPSAGIKIYTKSDKKIYKLDTLGNETEIGTGGSGGINYLSANADAETNTTGWSTYADAAGTSPVDGTGGSPNITWTRSTSAPIRGVASFLLTKGAANRQGEGVSYQFTHPGIVEGGTISFEYNVVSGTYATGDVRVYLVDVTTGAVIEPVNVEVPNVGITAKHIATFQTNASSTSYRFCIHIASTSASAYTLKFDTFVVGPQASTFVQTGFVGQIISTSSTTPPSGFLYCDGSAVSRTQYAELFAAIGTTFGSGDGSTTFNLPDGQGIFLRGTGSQTIGGISYTGGAIGTKQNDAYQGHWHTLGNTSGTATTTRGLTGSGGALESASTGAGRTNMERAIASTSDGTNGTPRTASETRPANMTVAYHICWRAGTTNAAADSGRVVAAVLSGSGTQTVGPNNSDVKMTYDTIGIDTHRGVNLTDSSYTIKEAGTYKIRIAAATSTTNVLANLYFVRAYKNGLPLATCGREKGIAGSELSFSGEYQLDLVAGDVLTFYFTGVGNNSSSQVTLQSGFVGRSVYISKISSGSQAITAGETYSGRYTTTAAQALGTGSATTVVWGTRSHDTHGSTIMNTSTGEMTIPVAGKWNFSAMLRWPSTLNNHFTYIGIYKNGSEVSCNLQAEARNGVTYNSSTTINDTLDLVAGDVITIRAYNNNQANLVNTANTCVVTFERIG